MNPHRTLFAGLCASLLLAISPRLVHAAEFALPTDGTVVGDVRVVTVESDATLYDIARHYDLGFEEITSSNPDVNVWVPGRGRRIIVPTEFILPPKPWSGIVVNLAARRLYYFPKPVPGKPATVVTFPIGIGRLDWPTPLGRTTIIAKVRNPSWVVPKAILAEHEREGDPLPPVVPPGPNNPMGLLALQTGFPEVYIHGTNEPWGVGGLVSHGCIHLYPEDVAAIFDRVPVGTPVRIIDDPDLVGERNGVLFLAAFKSSSDAPDAASAGQRAIDAVAAYLGNRSTAIDWERVRAAAELASTVPTPISAKTIDFWDLAADIPAKPYTDPPYGPDANAAAPPSPRSDRFAGAPK
ncbi:MAG: L,D-transpeptidase family protein [Pseudomonadota bacterium]